MNWKVLAGLTVVLACSTAAPEARLPPSPTQSDSLAAYLAVLKVARSPEQYGGASPTERIPVVLRGSILERFFSGSMITPPPGLDEAAVKEGFVDAVCLEQYLADCPGPRHSQVVTLLLLRREAGDTATSGFWIEDYDREGTGQPNFGIEGWTVRLWKTPEGAWTVLDARLQIVS
jgi:hypothetical protein